ncbi:MAG: hypothetical protein IAE98_10120, partial [Candidatus Kapabacteria bacterium]|nr:hypothetical protein [Candidatus Kapabacteria bacterium]
MMIWLFVTVRASEVLLMLNTTGLTGIETSAATTMVDTSSNTMARLVMAIIIDE